MQYYRGTSRRQLGGSLWDTIKRGARPLLQGILKNVVNKDTLKTIGKKAAASALNVGTELATSAMTGNLNKDQVVQKLKGEAIKLKDDSIKTYKRKFCEDVIQEGRGRKRRKIVPKRSKSMSKRSCKRKSKSRGCKRKPKRAGRKRPIKSKTRRNSRKKSINKRRKSIKKAFKDIFQR